MLFEFQEDYDGDDERHDQKGSIDAVGLVFQHLSVPSKVKMSCEKRFLPVPYASLESP